MPTTWTNQDLKQGAVSLTWADSGVTWADALYEWDGNPSTVWTNQNQS